ncbi:hypothetical protein SNE40_001033 [Patella caerulea]|uniref:Uncharacterized protein n=1 Tax=Patella caerulea TaxID=87958 RepID=A0AAN8KDL2_PATCE
MAYSLIEAIRRGDTAEAIALIRNSSKSGNIDSQTVKRDGTALFWACWRGDMELVLLLLQYGADVNARNCWNSTPLHAACDSNHPEIARHLLLHGANTDSQTLTGDTPCHLAAYRGYAPVVQVLIENGASLSVLNRNRRTSLDEATLSGNTNLVNYIEAVCDIISSKDLATDTKTIEDAVTCSPIRTINRFTPDVRFENRFKYNSSNNTSLYNNLSMDTTSNVSQCTHWNIRE